MTRTMLLGFLYMCQN